MLKNLIPKEARKIISRGEFSGQTAGLCPGYAQGNLVILPKEYAFDFLLFAQRNPKACPILEVVAEGKELLKTAPGEKITEVIPKYRIYENGQLTGEYTSIDDCWQSDFVTFILGCSFTFESALIEAGIPMRHIEENKNVAMYRTSIACESAGLFRGEMVVSMRPIASEHIMKTIEITSKFPSVHGSPVHIGHPEAIGITNIDQADFGDNVTIQENEVLVFWACGVTPQGIAMKVKPSIMITHAPGHMLITDIANESLKV